MKMNNKAYTLAELMIVIAIVLVLAAAAITGGASVIKNLKFGNAFNKIVFTVQRARSAALTAKDAQTVSEYRVSLDNSMIALSAEGSGGSETIVDSYTIDTRQTMELAAYDISNGLPGAICSDGAAISFAVKTAAAAFECAGSANPSPALLKIVLMHDDGSKKSFIIHKEAGIPQVQ